MQVKSSTRCILLAELAKLQPDSTLTQLQVLELKDAEVATQDHAVARRRTNHFHQPDQAALTHCALPCLQMQKPVVALVGYTNAGKSTLLNCLTEAGVVAEDKLFATLDPTTRRVNMPSGRDVSAGALLAASV